MVENTKAEKSLMLMKEDCITHGLYFFWKSGGLNYVHQL